MRARLQERCAVVRREHVHRREDQPVERIVLDVALCGVCAGAVGGRAAPLDERWMGGGRRGAAAVLGDAAEARRPAPPVSPTPTVRACVRAVRTFMPQSISSSTRYGEAWHAKEGRRESAEVQRSARFDAERSWPCRDRTGGAARALCACAEGAQGCAERALNGKMSEASLMSFASTLRRGKRSAHSSSALSEIALKRSFFSGTAAAMSIDVSASADTSIEASTSCIHTPAVARAARALDAGVNVDSCSAVASAGSMRRSLMLLAAIFTKVTQHVFNLEFLNCIGRKT